LSCRSCQSCRSCRSCRSCGLASLASLAGLVSCVLYLVSCFFCLASLAGQDSFTFLLSPFSFLLSPFSFLLYPFSFNPFSFTVLRLPRPQACLPVGRGGRRTDQGLASLASQDSFSFLHSPFYFLLLPFYFYLKHPDSSSSPGFSWQISQLSLLTQTWRQKREMHF